MRPSKYISPVIPWVLIFVWIFHQRMPLSSAEEAPDGLVAKPEAGQADPQSDGVAATDKPASSEQTTDWKKAAAEILRLSTSKDPVERRGLTVYMERFEAMEPGEIIAVFKAIAEEKWEGSSKAYLEVMLMTPLIKKDPELALRHFGERLPKQTSGLNSQLQKGFGAWAAKDLAAATAWFDGLTEKGVFDSTRLNESDPLWLGYEAALVRAAMGSDFPAASKRVEGLPPEVRAELLMHPLGAQIVDPQEQIGYGKLSRQFLTEESMETLLDWMSISAVARGGYKEVVAVLERFQATPEERADIAEKVAEFPLRAVAGNRKVTVEDIEKVREWAVSQGSKRVERITGVAIGSVAGSAATGLAGAYELIHHYHARNPNDALLAGFLAWPAVRQDQAQCDSLVRKIVNKKVREEVLEDFE